ncbi:UDP-N-acetylmuramoyl-tripeptide--D-alanyl-D-alanine ligase [Clostridium polyendosporum]|uniref:UDP-N-acetylmuramoyl-tripeptide--D-alanyl-D-alanine ligase n=1 Tax=Clostridium polyendosporum TaxID=69208 RepID=A0A919RYU9_9CLOT|nr:UDP-N-acetylmuramoyl-tripeptide--D-alanyl-D-alanine ligase [Clostridium polyendosporum]GIM27985.1 UDP-N-acetylmuramoyl-tripeptide--D-alanyl-D-alanine ligase [Clostridium polyendosporum]
MELLSINEILSAINGEIIVDGKDYFFSNVNTDTRKIEENSIFFALKGENFNGNDYVLEAAGKGAKICIVDEVKIPENTPVNCTIIKVNSTREALLNLAKYYREKLGIKIIGVTGSTGKTSTKDILAALLSERFKVFKTIGNYNNEIGLPLMIFQLDRSYDVAVLEMGMSNFNEIHVLADASRPDIALITNIGMSHIENLKSRENILKAKMEIVDFFNKDNFLVVNGDDDFLADLMPDNYQIIKTGTNDNFNIYAKDIKLLEDCTEFAVEAEGEEYRFVLPMLGKHNVQNCLLGIAAGRLLGMSLKDMNKGLNNIVPTSMRLEIIKKDDFIIINDCYNASPSSIKAALDVQKNIQGKRKIAILGTMRELGDESFNAHMEVGKYAKVLGVDLILACGEFSEGYEEGFGKEGCILFDTKEMLINSLKNNLKKEDIILVKASRGMKFEDIIKELKGLNL